jgi:VanZ family protein
MMLIRGCSRRQGDRLVLTRGRDLIKANFALITAVMMAVILYGSLYPFAFQVPPDGIGPVRALLATWANRPGRGDFLSNILLYLPLGYFAFLAWAQPSARSVRVILALFLGTMLSLSVELTQYFEPARDSTLTDVYSNMIGTALGATISAMTTGRWHTPLWRAIADHREPALLLAGWLGYRLFPYVPVVDLHKYWDALKPVVLHPSFSLYDLCRHTASWLVVYALVAALAPKRYAAFLAAAFAGATVFAEILIIGRVLSVAELLGAAAAFAFWMLLGIHERLRLTIVTLFFALMVVAQRLEPFAFAPAPSHFGWVPFYGFMHGSIGVDMQSFLEKFFLYGTLLWLLVQLGWRMSFAATLVCLALLVTSIIEMYLPGRSAEITDAVMALAIAAVAELLRRDMSLPQPIMQDPLP